MSELSVNRACGACGERIRLTATTERGYYDCPLEAMLSLKPSDRLVLETRCGCPEPRRVCFEGQRIPADVVA